MDLVQRYSFSRL